MRQSGMMNFVNLAICIFFLGNNVDTQVNIPAVTPPRNGDTANLTCIISPFILPAVWKNNDNGAHITACFNTGTCSPSSDGVSYQFFATASSITVMISNFSSTVDTFTWKCEHGGIVTVYRIMSSTLITITTAVTQTPSTTVTTAPGTIVTTTSITTGPPTANTGINPTSNIASVTTTPNATVSMAPNATVSMAPNTTVSMTPNTTVSMAPNATVSMAPNTTVSITPNTTVSMASNATELETVMPLPVATLCQLQLALIIGVTVGSSVLIIAIIICCCCCCPCCFLYNCQNKYVTDSDAINKDMI
ncbi:hypothetical protein CHS0354_032110 [Potamilus streckersoni]|nr:hypothetical protein CHS0354_032110 [Potamilus streckersoni]